MQELPHGQPFLQYLQHGVERGRGVEAAVLVGPLLGNANPPLMSTRTALNRIRCFIRFLRLSDLIQILPGSTSKDLNSGGAYGRGESFRQRPTWLLPPTESRQARHASLRPRRR